MVTEFRLPKLKYCGLTRAEDVTAAIECGADAIGLNFYERSSRYIAPESGNEFYSLTNHRAMVVGVFVNARPAQVASVLSICPLDCIQLHGEESSEWMIESLKYSSLRSLPVIKAIAWRNSPEDESTALDWSSLSDARLMGLLVDAYDPVQRGGTGKTARWDLLFPRPAAFGNRPMMLAGGIRAENVAKAIEIAKPWGIDVASGIEMEPGVKDREKMQAIAQIALPLL
jgi:phosphoribosylanthranilate isomerase